MELERLLDQFQSRQRDVTRKAKRSDNQRFCDAVRVHCARHHFLALLSVTLC